MKFRIDLMYMGHSVFHLTSDYASKDKAEEEGEKLRNNWIYRHLPITVEVKPAV